MIAREVSLLDGPCATHRICVMPHDGLEWLSITEVIDNNGCERTLAIHNYRTHCDDSGRLVGVYDGTERRPLPHIGQVPA